MDKGCLILDRLQNLADELHREMHDDPHEVVLHPDDFAALAGYFDAPPSAALLTLELSVKIFVLRSPRIRLGMADYAAILRHPVYEYQLYDGLEDAVSRAEE